MDYKPIPKWVLWTILTPPIIISGNIPVMLFWSYITYKEIKKSTSN